VIPVNGTGAALATMLNDQMLLNALIMKNVAKKGQV